MSAPVAQRRGLGTAVALLRLAGAGLLAAIAGIHLYLWRDGYDSIDVIGPAFLLQTVLGFGGALLLLVAPPRLLVWAAVLGLLFSAGSLAALLQSTRGLFGLEPGLFDFVESDVAPLWQETFWVEVAAVVVLLVLTVLAAVRRRG
ncbi:hypothetical protein [Blastococcus sp. TF02A-26]|uniref:hypothetical protein n=1 Tax=Blastococcus sp. TF02A-26 TaxID=2250577 RepID=UPI000DEB69A1|nr:hypothetical protein [Blastococcus sp. TF02A-26]RBY85131.1 hypothetical protein DQ240_12950 [Blastococcus sp. TF02A-26]